MERLIYKDVAVPFPTVAADTSGVLGVMRINSISAAGSVAIPAGCVGKYLRVVPVGGGVQAGASFGMTGETLAWNQASAWGTGSAAAGASAGLATGPVVLEGIAPIGATFLNYVPETGKTISLEIYVTELVGWDV